ncbi:MAG: M23 family metallopeptidase [Sphingobium sp.]
MGWECVSSRLTGALLLAMLSSCVPQGRPAAIPAPAPVPAPPAVKVAKPEGRLTFLLVGDARQGAVMRGTAPGGTRRLTFNGVEISVTDKGEFIIAFDRDAESHAVLRAERSDGSVVTQDIPVRPGEWRIENVDASPTANIPSAAFVARRKPELERIAAARAINAQSDGWRQAFRWPATGRISGLFGAQRIYRGTPGSYHGGVDVVAPAGTPFVAPADGVVVLAAEQPFTLEGYLLIIDHGMGLNSAFLHCSSLAVKEGDVVRQGQVLGRIGATGRATGPHLHWSMKWRDARLDPATLAGPMP